MQRVHLSPRLGATPVAELTTGHMEGLAAAMLEAGLAPKTVRNVLTFLHSVFEHALDRGLVRENPVRRAARPGRRRPGDANPDLQFLTVEELEAVIRAIPDEVVDRRPAPNRRGRAGPAPPPPPDVIGPVLRVLVLAAARRAFANPSCSGCVGTTSTGPPNGSGSATPTCEASTRARGSLTSRRAAPCRWPTGWPASSIGGRAGRCTPPTTTSSSPTRTAAGRSIARR